MIARADGLDSTESVDIALKVVTTANGPKVLTQWHQPRAHIFWSPQEAFNFAEQLARAAHRARFPGERLREDYSYLTQQVKERLTDEMRDRLAIRIRTMLPGLLESRNYDFMSKQIVDTIFSAIDPESNNRLGKDVLAP